MLQSSGGKSLRPHVLRGIIKCLSSTARSSPAHFPLRSSVSNRDAAIQQHLSHCEHSRHDELHCAGPTGKHHDCRLHQIWLCELGQPELGSVQRQSIHSNVRTHFPSSSTARQLRIAGAPRLDHHLCLVQSPAKARAVATRIRRESLQPPISRAVHCPRPGSDPQYAIAPAWLGSVQPESHHASPRSREESAV